MDYARETWSSSDEETVITPVCADIEKNTVIWKEVINQGPDNWLIGSVRPTQDSFQMRINGLDTNKSHAIANFEPKLSCQRIAYFAMPQLDQKL